MSDIEAQKELIRQLYVELATIRSRLDEEKGKRVELEQDIIVTKSSFSWRVTGPIRFARNLFWSQPQRISSMVKQLLNSESIKVARSDDLSLRRKSVKSVSEQSKVLQRSGHVFGGNIVALYDTSISTKDWDQLGNTAYDQSPLGAYDARNPAVISSQIQLAKQTGLDGFCYLYDSSKVSSFFQGPISHHAENGSIDFGFCLAWTVSSEPSELATLSFDFCVKRFHRYASGMIKNSNYLRFNGMPMMLFVGGSAHLFQEFVQICIALNLSVEAGFCFIHVDDDGVLQFVDNHGVRISSQTVSERLEFIEFDDSTRCEPKLQKAVQATDSGSYLFLAGWNTWRDGSALESLDDRAQSFRSKLQVLTRSVRKGIRQQRPVLLVQDESEAVVARAVAALSSAEFDLRVIFLNSPAFSVGAPFRSLRGRTSLTAWDYTLLPLETEGCSQLLLITDLESNTRQRFDERGWHLDTLEHFLNGLRSNEVSIVFTAEVSKTDIDHCLATILASKRYLVRDVAYNTQISDLNSTLNKLSAETIWIADSNATKRVDILQYDQAAMRPGTAALSTQLGWIDELSIGDEWHPGSGFIKECSSVLSVLGTKQSFQFASEKIEALSGQFERHEWIFWLALRQFGKVRVFGRAREKEVPTLALKKQLAIVISLSGEYTTLEYIKEKLLWETSLLDGEQLVELDQKIVTLKKNFPAVYT